MARALSTEKRSLIKQTAAALFADRGFAATSVADIAGQCDLPVGSIYTYFENKEDIIRAIVSEGWDQLRVRLRAELLGASTPEQRVSLLIDRFFPELLEDVDFITILLREGIAYTGIEEKVDELVGLLHELLLPFAARSNSLAGLSRTQLEAALLVYFLGVMDAVRLTRASSLSVTTDDLLNVLRVSIRNALGVNLSVP